MSHRRSTVRAIQRDHLAKAPVVYAALAKARKEFPIAPRSSHNTVHHRIPLNPK